MANRSSITFIDTSKEAKKTMANLSKTALRASAKVIRKKIRETIASTGLVHSNRFKNHIYTSTFIDKQTGQPQLRVGFATRSYLLSKGKKVSRASPHWIEFGTKPHKIDAKNGHYMAYEDNVYGFHVQHPGQKATHLLRDTVQNNIAEIRAAQEQYLAELNKTLEEAGAKVYAGEEEEDD